MRIINIGLVKIFETHTLTFTHTQTHTLSWCAHTSTGVLVVWLVVSLICNRVALQYHSTTLYGIYSEQIADVGTFTHDTLILFTRVEIFVLLSNSSCNNKAEGIKISSIHKPSISISGYFGYGKSVWIWAWQSVRVIQCTIPYSFIFTLCVDILYDGYMLWTSVKIALSFHRHSNIYYHESRHDVTN